MKPLNWIKLTKKQIKARNGFGWSIEGIGKQNKVLIITIKSLKILKIRNLIVIILNLKYF